MPRIDMQSPEYDTIEQAQNWLDGMLNAYPVWGYSTRLAIVSTTNGKWRVTGSRWSSSD